MSMIDQFDSTEVAVSTMDILDSLANPDDDIAAIVEEENNQVLNDLIDKVDFIVENVEELTPEKRFINISEVESITTPISYFPSEYFDVTEIIPKMLSVFYKDVVKDPKENLVILKIIRNCVSKSSEGMISFINNSLPLDVVMPFLMEDDLESVSTACDLLSAFTLYKESAAIIERETLLQQVIDILVQMVNNVDEYHLNQNLYQMMKCVMFVFKKMVHSLPESHLSSNIAQMLDALSKVCQCPVANMFASESAAIINVLGSKIGFESVVEHPIFWATIGLLSNKSFESSYPEIFGLLANALAKLPESAIDPGHIPLNRFIPIIERATEIRNYKMAKLAIIATQNLIGYDQEGAMGTLHEEETYRVLFKVAKNSTHELLATTQELVWVMFMAANIEQQAQMLTCANEYPEEEEFDEDMISRPVVHHDDEDALVVQDMLLGVFDSDTYLLKGLLTKLVLPAIQTIFSNNIQNDEPFEQFLNLVYDSLEEIQDDPEVSEPADQILEIFRRDEEANSID